MSGHGASRAVGPVLEANEVGHAIAAAIKARDPDATIIDRGAYLRVSCDGICVLERSRVEALLSREFELPGALEQVMPSFAGRIALERDSVTWRCDA